MNKTTFNPKRDLPYLAAIAQVVQFVNAGYTLMGWRGAVCGLFLGGLVSMTVAYAASQYGEIAKERKRFALPLLVMLLAFSPVVVGTATYLDLPFTGIWAGFVAAAWGILPDFSVALDGFIAGKGMVKKDEQPAEQPAAQDAQPKKQVAKQVAPRRQELTTDNLIAEIKRNPGATDEQIAATFGVSRQAINNRRRKLTPAELGF